MIIGAVGLYYFDYQGIKPEWLQLDVFTFYSSYLSSKSLTFIPNNQGDEIATVLYFAGAILLMGAAEKNEKPFHPGNRIRALAGVTVLILFLFLLGYIFLHGMAVVFGALALPYLIPLIYFALFSLFNKTSVR